MDKRLSIKYQDKTLPEISPEIPVNGIITVGNDASATVELKDDSVAPEQFVLVCEPEQIILMCRVAGTIINGKPVPQGTIHNLQEGDTVTVGDYRFALGGGENPIITTTETPPPPQSDITEIQESRSERTLTDVLKSLRSEEKFYFQIETEDGETQRLFVETEVAYLGKTEEGDYVFTEDESEIETPSVQIRKDWSGVVAYPLASSNIWLGDRILTKPHRLKNDDTLYLQAQNSQKPDLETVIRFHEPTALLVLDSILPKELPPPVSLDEDENQVEEIINQETDLHISQIPTGEILRQKRLLFGYFTLTEIVVMIIGTLITAAIIFLVLEFY